ncbi:hypothetical protein TNIN_149131, partial [Trichonephila inaurata madagascariensis]
IALLEFNSGMASPWFLKLQKLKKDMPSVKSAKLWFQPFCSCSILHLKVSSVEKIRSPGTRQTAQVFQSTGKFKRDVLHRKIKKMDTL